MLPTLILLYVRSQMSQKSIQNHKLFSTLQNHKAHATQVADDPHSPFVPSLEASFELGPIKPTIVSPRREKPQPLCSPSKKPMRKYKTQARLGNALPLPHFQKFSPVIGYKRGHDRGVTVPGGVRRRIVPTNEAEDAPIAPNGRGWTIAPLSIMKLLSWNPRGLGSPLGLRALLDLIKKEVPSLVFL